MSSDAGLNRETRYFSLTARVEDSYGSRSDNNPTVKNELLEGWKQDIAPILDKIENQLESFFNRKFQNPVQKFHLVEYKAGLGALLEEPKDSGGIEALS